MVTILCTLRECRQTFTSKEKSVIDKLIARRDLWTDEQYLALCTQVRPLGSVKVKGNLGMSALADLPSGPRGTKTVQRSAGDGAVAGSDAAVVDLTGNSVEADEGARNKSHRKQKSHSRPSDSKSKKHAYRRGEVDSLSSNSDDDKLDAEAESSKPKKKQKGKVGGVMSILADMENNGAHSGARTLTVGGHVVHVGGAASKDVGMRDALGKRTRRLTRSAEELQDEFLTQVLWWDLRQKSRYGLACSKVPISFDSLDQYEDTFGGLLLEETWEQITSAFSEENAEVEDDTADFGALSVHSYDEIGDFVYAAVCPDRESRAVHVGTLAKGGPGHWGGAPNEMDLVLLVSPDSFADEHSSARGFRHAQQRGQERKKQARMEHVLALVDKAQRGDADMGIVRLKVLSRKTPRNNRFCERLARVSTRNGCSGAVHRSLEPGSMPNSDKEAHTRLRMVCLNYNISTSIREFVALHSLRSLDDTTQHAILAPGRGVAQGVSSRKGNMAVVPNGSLNDDQMQAISKCLEPGPVFSLIQGPPGTGSVIRLRLHIHSLIHIFPLIHL